MLSYYKGTIPVLNDDPDSDDFAFPGRVRFGATPRDYSAQPAEAFAPPADMPLIPESEWDARYDEQEARQSSLEHLYLRSGGPAFVNLDQNGHGYCWSYSTGHAIMMLRLAMNLPPVRLNPHATAAIIKRGRDEGGWCGLSAQFAREHGYAVEGTGPGQWPLHSRDLRHDTPELRANMALHKVTEDWVDLQRDVYDQNLTRAQLATCLLNGTPCPNDFSWWGHSVCAIRWVRIEKGSWGQLILNSWKGWGRHGLGVIQGDRTRTMGAVAARVTGASVK